MGETGEMSLEEYINQLPTKHRISKEYAKLKAELGKSRKLTRSYVDAYEKIAYPDELEEDEVVCFECAESIANCACPSGFNLGDVCKEAKKKANLCSCSICRQWAEAVCLNKNEYIGKSEAEKTVLLEYVRSLEAENVKLKRLRDLVEDFCKRAISQGEHLLPLHHTVIYGEMIDALANTQEKKP